METVVVLVVFGILVIIAAPNLAGYIRQTKVDQALNEVTGDIAYTRMLAVRSGYPAILAIQAGGTSYNIRAIHRVGTDTVRRVAKQVNLATDYRGVSLAPAATVLTFNSRGLLVPPPVDPINITAQHGSSNAVLKVLQTGRAYRDY
jgi:Tfp pilus assembly protein FimT